MTSRHLQVDVVVDEWIRRQVAGRGATRSAPTVSEPGRDYRTASVASTSWLSA